MRRHSRKRGNLRPLYIWHRRLGLMAGVFVLILCLTGLALNHTEALRLDERHVSSTWLLGWYGISPPVVTESFAVGDSWVSLVEDRVYLGQHALPGRFSQLAGAVALGGTIIVIADGDALVLTETGSFIERLGRINGVPAGIRQIGVEQGDGLVVSAANGQYRSQVELLDWRPGEQGGGEVAWSVAQAVPTELAGQLSRHYQSKILPLERVLLDIHSGRIAGGAGVLLMDLAAILLVLLAVSGGWIWIKRFG
jgi:hypothetical protein